MKTVEFIKTTVRRDILYECSLQGHWDDIQNNDHSGVYVLASEAQERERVLVEAAQEALTVTCKGWQANKLKSAIAALAAKEG